MTKIHFTNKPLSFEYNTSICGYPHNNPTVNFYAISKGPVAYNVNLTNDFEETTCLICKKKYREAMQ